MNTLRLTEMINKFPLNHHSFHDRLKVLTMHVIVLFRISYDYLSKSYWQNILREPLFTDP